MQEIDRAGMDGVHGLPERFIDRRLLVAVVVVSVGPEDDLEPEVVHEPEGLVAVGAFRVAEILHVVAELVFHEILQRHDLIGLLLD